MKNKTYALVGALGLATMLTLTGCTAASEDANNPDPDTSAPIETAEPAPSTGDPSEELAGVPFTTTVPESVKDILSPLTGEWFYQETSVQIQAIAYSYDPEALAAFVAKKEEEGWTHQFEPQSNEGTYVVGLKDSDGNTLTVVGMSSGAADDSGGTNAPASVITFVKA